MTGESNSQSSSARGARPVEPSAHWLIARLVVVILVASGLLFRVAIGEDAPVVRTPPRVVLSEFPEEFLGYTWTKDLALDPDIEKVLGAMAYVNRKGFRQRDRSVAQLWISYFGESKTKVEHEPHVCMRTGGWDLPQKEPIARDRVIPLTRPLANGDTTLPLNLYVFRKDVDYQLLVNTYCVNGKYYSNRDAATVKSSEAEGAGFYAQIRVVIPLGDLEWVQLQSRGGIGALYDYSRETDKVARDLAALDADLEKGNRERRGPYLRAAEILRHVVLEFERHLPLPETSHAAE